MDPGEKKEADCPFSSQKPASTTEYRAANAYLEIPTIERLIRSTLEQSSSLTLTIFLLEHLMSLELDLEALKRVPEIVETVRKLRYFGKIDDVSYSDEFRANAAEIRAKADLVDDRFRRLFQAAQNLSLDDIIDQELKDYRPTTPLSPLKSPKPNKRLCRVPPLHLSPDPSEFPPDLLESPWEIPPDNEIPKLADGKRKESFKDGPLDRFALSIISRLVSLVISTKDSKQQDYIIHENKNQSVSRINSTHQILRDRIISAVQNMLISMEHKPCSNSLVAEIIAQYCEFESDLVMARWLEGKFTRYSVHLNVLEIELLERDGKIPRFMRNYLKYFRRVSFDLLYFISNLVEYIKKKYK